MRKSAGPALLLSIAALFLISNSAAYKGYFQDDEIDNLSWTQQLGLSDFAPELVTLRFMGNNFRPVGHFYYYIMGRRFGLNFPKYVLIIHLLHILNIWMVWLLARRLGMGPVAASAGALFFAFHMAVFDTYWKPMYVFDVLCAFFCLLSCLLWTRRFWILSFLAFWLAYKSKELAVMLPAVLACYEFWVGQKRWKPLVPFFLVSLIFGVQGILGSQHTNTDYTLRFTPAAIWQSLEFYSSEIFLLPYGGLLLLAFPLLVRDRRVWFGIAATCLFFVPLLFLPRRLYGAYCYVPLLGTAIAVAALTARVHFALAAMFFALWIPWNYLHFGQARRETLAIAAENHSYITTVAQLARSSPQARSFVFDGLPAHFHRWGAEGALSYVYRRQDLRVLSVEDSGAWQVIQNDSPVLLNWDDSSRRLFILSRDPNSQPQSYITMGPLTPVWQLREGWYLREDGFRWIQPRAAAVLNKPENARGFELVVNIGPGQIQEMGHTDMEVSLEGKPIGRQQFTSAGGHTVHWPLPSIPAGTVRVEFRVAPEYHPANGDPRTLGIAIMSFGFLSMAK
jgi:hypothetical protein